MIQEVMNEISQVMAKVDEQQLQKILPLFTKQRRIFVRGAGRSGFQAKSFAMRLMHLGYEVYVLGETITPSVQERGFIYCHFWFRNNKRRADGCKKCARKRLDFACIYE